MTEPFECNTRARLDPVLRQARNLSEQFDHVNTVGMAPLEFAMLANAQAAARLVVAILVTIVGKA